MIQIFLMINYTFVCFGKPATVKLNQLPGFPLHVNLPEQSGAVVMTYLIQLRKKHKIKTLVSESCSTFYRFPESKLLSKVIFFPI